MKFGRYKEVIRINTKRFDSLPMQDLPSVKGYVQEIIEAEQRKRHEKGDVFFRCRNAVAVIGTQRYQPA